MRNKTTRRTFIKAAGTSTAATLLSGLPRGWVGGAYADDGPETPDIRFGIIALTDCAPIVMAHELGYFKKFGINSTVSKEASWAVIRDKLSLGENQATHMLIGMPLASTMGLAGSPVKPMVMPWLLNRNGQAITLNNKLKTAGVEDPGPDQAARREGQGRRRSADVRDDLSAGHARHVDPLLAGLGRHPSGQGRQPHHHSAAADGREHEGRQDGRLLRRRALEQPRHRGRHRLHRGHHAADCGRTTRKRSAPSPRSSRSKNPKTVKAILKALHLASVDLDKMENRPKFAEVIARPSYINCPPDTILERLLGKYDYGDGRVEQDPNYMIFSSRTATTRSRSTRKWWLTQFRRWGMAKTAPDYAAVAKRVLRSDLYLEAMKELGVTTKIAEEQKITLFDGVFDGKDPEQYARSFPIHSMA